MGDIHGLYGTRTTKKQKKIQNKPIENESETHRKSKEKKIMRNFFFGLHRT